MRSYLNRKTLDEVAIERIREFEPKDGYWLAFSGGKDSIVILDLAKRAGVRYEPHYNLTTVDPPEVVRFIKRVHPEVIVDRPARTMWQLIQYHRCLPTRWRRWCCTELKERGGRNRTVMTGIRWAESSARSGRRMVGYCQRQQKWHVCPIIDWEDGDVWQYICERGLAYCYLYDEGLTRVGCVLCPLKNQRERMQDFSRWPKLADGWRRACYRLWEAKPEFHEYHPTPEALWQWWLTGQIGGDRTMPLFDLEWDEMEETKNTPALAGVDRDGDR